MKHVMLAAVAAAATMSAAPAAAQLVVNTTTIGQRVTVLGTDDVIARFDSRSADIVSQLFLEGRSGVIFTNRASEVGTEVNLGSFAVGTELVFRLDVPVSFAGPAASYFTGPASRNPDNVFHAAASSTGTRTYVGFEDVRGGGDRDFNDLIFSFSNTAAVEAAVPEPATWGLMLLGMGMVGAGLRSRRRSTTVTYA